MVLLLFCFDIFDSPIYVVLVVRISHHSLFKQSGDIQYEILIAPPLSL